MLGKPGAEGVDERQRSNRLIHVDHLEDLLDAQAQDVSCATGLYVGHAVVVLVFDVVLDVAKQRPDEPFDQHGISGIRSSVAVQVVRDSIAVLVADPRPLLVAREQRDISVVGGIRAGDHVGQPVRPAFAPGDGSRLRAPDAVSLIGTIRRRAAVANPVAIVGRGSRSEVRQEMVTVLVDVDGFLPLSGRAHEDFVAHIFGIVTTAGVLVRPLNVDLGHVEIGARFDETMRPHDAVEDVQRGVISGSGGAEFPEVDLRSGEVREIRGILGAPAIVLLENAGLLNVDGSGITFPADIDVGILPSIPVDGHVKVTVGIGPSRPHHLIVDGVQIHDLHQDAIHAHGLRGDVVHAVAVSVPPDPVIDHPSLEMDRVPPRNMTLARGGASALPA